MLATINTARNTSHHTCCSCSGVFATKNPSETHVPLSTALSYKQLMSRPLPLIYLNRTWFHVLNTMNRIQRIITCYFMSRWCILLKIMTDLPADALFGQYHSYYIAHAARKIQSLRWNDQDIQWQTDTGEYISWFQECQKVHVPCTGSKFSSSSDSLYQIFQNPLLNHDAYPGPETMGKTFRIKITMY